jgi:hypothetical protein
VRVNPSSVAIRDFEFLDSREEPGENLGFFGGLSLSKSWETLITTLSYQRSASTASGIATSTDLDVATVSADWRPRRAWRVTGSASWERQVSSSEVSANDLLLSSTPTTLFVDANGRIVSDPMDAAFVIPNAGQTVGLTTERLVDNAIDIQATRLEIRVQRDVTRRLTVAGMATWWRQEFQGDLQADEVVSDARFELSLTWRLAPIDL